MDVILYTRVSTDEQAEGLSREAQERQLRSYCDRHGYHIVGDEKPYKEDYSAKHYDLQRPKLKEIYDYCKRNKGKVDKVLFLRWDRYSRNVEFAFAYKRKFEGLGVEINAIENTIDFSAPDWATMLAIYCGTAHSEDNKISERTREGIHEHLMNGEWVRLAPKGYKNVRYSKTECAVVVDEAVAPIIKQVFMEVAKGLEVPACIRRRLCPTIAKTTFFNILRNPFYMGYIRVPAYKDDPAQLVKSKSEALIDRKTFEAVQDVLDGNKKRKSKLSKSVKPDLYLRKFLSCPVCGAPLTGATSRGNGGLYPYYFCNKEHKHLNKRAEDVNEGFCRYVSCLKPHKAILELYNEILQDMRGDRVKENKKQADKLEIELESIQKRIDKVMDSYIDGDITKVEKERYIERYERQQNELKERIEALRLSKDMQIKDKIEYSVNIIENLGNFFQTASPETKILLLGSIFKDKIEFDGKNYRTNSYNMLLDVIYQETNMLRGENKKDSPEFSGESNVGWKMGFEPTTPSATN